MIDQADLEARKVEALERIAGALEKLTSDAATWSPPEPTRNPDHSLSPGLPAAGWIAVPTPYNTAMHVAYCKGPDADGRPVMVSVCGGTSFSGFDLGRAARIDQVATVQHCGQQACQSKYRWLLTERS